MPTPYPAPPTTTTNTLVDYLVSQLGSDLYCVLPLGVDATDQSGNARDFTDVGSPSYGSAPLIDESKNEANASVLFSNGKYIRRQNDSASGVVASIGGKGLTVIFVGKLNIGTASYRGLFDFRRASGTAGRNGVCFEVNNNIANSGQDTTATLRLVAAGGNVDYIAFNTADGTLPTDAFWKDTNIHMFLAEYRKGDKTAGLPSHIALEVDGQVMTPATTSLTNITTADTFTDSSTAGDYLTFGSYYDAYTPATGSWECAYAIIIKRLLTADEKYAIQQCMSKTPVAGIPLGLNGAFYYSADSGGAQTDGASMGTVSDTSGFGGTSMTNPGGVNAPLYHLDQLQRLGISFDNQMDAQGGDPKYANCAVAPNGKTLRRGVLVCGSVMAQDVLAQSWQRVLTYTGTSLSWGFSVRAGLPVIDPDGSTTVYPASTSGIAGSTDKSLPRIPCVPQVGTWCYGTGRDGIRGRALIGCGGRIAAGTTATVETGDYANDLTGAGKIGASTASEGASLVLKCIMDIGRPVLPMDYARFHNLMQRFYNPTTDAEFASAKAELTAAGLTYVDPLDHAGVRDIGLNIDGDSLSCATPKTGTTTDNRGYQGRFSPAFTRRLAYVHTNAIGGSLMGPDKNSDGTAQSGFTLNVLDNIGGTDPARVADQSSGPITHILLYAAGTNTMARAAASPNSGADISAYGALRSAAEAFRRFRSIAPQGLVFWMLPSADITGTTKTSMIAQAAAWKADGTITDYIIPTAKSDIHWTNAEQAAEAARIEDLITNAMGVGSEGLHYAEVGRFNRFGRFSR